MIDRRFPNPLARYKPPDAAHIVHDPLTGKHFGTYEVLEPLGSGGMAEIYRGRHTSLNREVAIKVLRSGFGIDPEFRIRFEREAQTVAALRHSNIVQVFDFGVQDGQHYMVMEFIRGYDLARYLRENGRLKLSEALPIIQDVAAALDYAHEQGLIHRDVKPSNVMLQPVTGSQIKIQSPLQAYRAILTDFGVAKILSDGSDLTKTGVVGTLDYLAPEQIIAPKDIDRRADVYAFGAMVYEMLCGRPPFKDENYGVVLYAHLQQPPPDPRTIVPELPENAARVMLRALAKDRAERFATAGAFSAALTGVTPPV